MLLPTSESSHWESGFIRILENGIIEISNSQDSGRVEVLQGKIEPIEDAGFKMEFNSTVLENDPRLVQTKRIFEITSNKLVYRKFMATHTTPTPNLMQHLEAELERV